MKPGGSIDSYDQVAGLSDVTGQIWLQQQQRFTLNKAQENKTEGANWP